MTAPAARAAPETAPAPFELQAMAQAVNYYAWLADYFRPQLTGLVVEHGSGTGLLSARLLAAGIAPLILTEPDEALAAGLREKFAGQERLEVFPGTLEDFLVERGPEAVGTIISANVLEHVEDDEGCLRAMYRALKPGGHICLYVPARPELFGSLDRVFHHQRRYRRNELRGKLSAAGFIPLSLRYRNLANVPPWWIMGQVLRRGTLNLQHVRLYDRLFFPWLRRLEDLLPPPYGLNLLALAQKPAG